RFSTVTDIAQAIEDFGEDLVTQREENSGFASTFHVSTQGVPQPLAPDVRDEICRITFEAVRNAFRHAEARRIEVNVVYGDPVLQVRIRDDGRGIEASVLNHGRRPGHWGLAGMRERATRIGARLDISSRPEAGTDVELNLPTSVSELA